MTIVTALIRDEKGRFLLQKRIDAAEPDADGKWELPGGKIAFGELPEDAIRRECREEIGSEIFVERLLPIVWSNVWSRKDNRDTHVLVLCYEARIVSGAPMPVDAKVSEVRWFGTKEIGDLETLPGISEFVRISEGMK